MKMLKVVCLVVVLFTVLLLAGCTEADRVSTNVSKEADNFNVLRHVMVINTRTDRPLLEVDGRASINTRDGDINIIIEVGEGVYKKHFVSTNEYTVYVVEDINGVEVSPYYYEINILPKMFQTFTITHND